MTVLTTKFSVGDVVYKGDLTTTEKMHDCPDCLGKKEWTVTSPAGETYTFKCPRCSLKFSINDAASLKYFEYKGYVRKLTIGSVRVDTNDMKHGITYMCKETGVGSGSVYYEAELFSTREAAEKDADDRAKHQNSTNKQVIEKYKWSLEASQYQLNGAKPAMENKLNGMKLEAIRELTVELQNIIDGVVDTIKISEVQKILDRIYEV